MKEQRHFTGASESRWLVKTDAWYLRITHSGASSLKPYGPGDDVNYVTVKYISTPRISRTLLIKSGWYHDGIPSSLHNVQSMRVFLYTRLKRFSMG